MTTSETPPGMAGLADSSFLGRNVRESAPNSVRNQAEFLRDPRADRAPHLRLVPPPRPPRPRLREVRVTAVAGRYPYGGITRSFQLTDHGVDELIALAERLEARRS